MNFLWEEKWNKWCWWVMENNKEKNIFNFMFLQSITIWSNGYKFEWFCVIMDVAGYWILGVVCTSKDSIQHMYLVLGMVTGVRGGMLLLRLFYTSHCHCIDYRQTLLSSQNVCIRIMLGVVGEARGWKWIKLFLYLRTIIFPVTLFTSMLCAMLNKMPCFFLHRTTGWGWV